MLVHEGSWLGNLHFSAHYQVYICLDGTSVLWVLLNEDWSVWLGTLTLWWCLVKMVLARNVTAFWMISNLCFLVCSLRPKERREEMPLSRRRRRSSTTDLHKPLQERTLRTSSECATSRLLSTTLSFTLLISLEEKPTLVSPEVWRSRLTEKSLPHMLVSEGQILRLI